MNPSIQPIKERCGLFHQNVIANSRVHSKYLATAAMIENEFTSEMAQLHLQLLGLWKTSHAGQGMSRLFFCSLRLTLPSYFYL